MSKTTEPVKAEPQDEPEIHHDSLAKALVAAQTEMPAVKPDATNPHFKNKFVTLGHLIAKARPVINEHGIAVSQFPSADADGKPTLVTILMHESGERLQFDAPLFLSKSDPQGQGSAITYMRRYALASALGISDQEDDDGNAGSKGDAKAEKPKAQTNGAVEPGAISVATAKMLRATAEASDVAEERVVEWLRERGGLFTKLSVKQAEEFSLWLDQQQADTPADTEGLA